jgi:hypothetical protein
MRRPPAPSPSAFGSTVVESPRLASTLPTRSGSAFVVLTEMAGCLAPSSLVQRRRRPHDHGGRALLRHLHVARALHRLQLAAAQEARAAQPAVPVRRDARAVAAGRAGRASRARGARGAGGSGRAGGSRVARDSRRARAAGGAGASGRARCSRGARDSSRAGAAGRARRPGGARHSRRGPRLRWGPCFPWGRWRR